MTPADALRRAIADAETLAANLRAALAPLEGQPGAVTMAAPVKADRILSTAQAFKLSKRAYSSLYRDARAHGFGWQLPTRTWQFSERGLRKFLAQEKSRRGEVGEVGDAEGIPLANESAHIHNER